MEIILEPGRAEKNYWHDLWRYRELFQVLAWRDLRGALQTDRHWAWRGLSSGQFSTMVIFTVIFGRLAKLPHEGKSPHALMVFHWTAAVDVLFYRAWPTPRTA